MPQLPDAREGSVLKIKGRLVEFSPWPVARTTRRYGTQSRIFVTNPWAIIRGAINKRCPASAKAQAHAFRDQAEDYFNAARNAGLLAAKPVLLYYSLLNLAKTYVLTVGQHANYGSAYHGLKERLGTGGRELSDSYLEAVPTGANVNVFDDFLFAVRGAALPCVTQYKLPHLLPQILQGHRLWCTAADETERFIEIDRVSIKQNTGTKQIWIQLEFYEDDLIRLGASHSSLLTDSKLAASFSDVKGVERNGRKVLLFQQNSPIDYTHRPSDKLQELVNSITPCIWSKVLSIPPYRKHYVYLSPASEHSFVLPQVLSIYAVFYYFGSATRYKPEKFSKLISETYGAQIEEIITNLPNQYLYLMASYFMKREVTRAAIV